MQTEPTIVIEVQEQKNEAVQPELLYSQLAAASASADALDITMPADVPAAAEDTSEAPAVDVSSQHSIHDENGYYVYNGTENDTYNSLTKDGLWVGGVDDNTGFHVDNKGHASANGLDVQNQKITGVADGEFNADSTDAVTAGQLYDAGIVPGKAADGSVAIGNGSNVTNINGVAIGNKALVNYSVENGVAIGQGAEVRTDNATAIGQGSRVVSGDGSVALGQGSMVTATDAKGTDAHGVVSVGLTGNKVTEGFTRRIINVADGVNDTDAATVGQISKITGMDSEKGNVVQYDGEDKSTITFAGTNGTALNNVNDIVMNVKNPINKKTEQHSFQNAGLLPGKVEGKATSGKWNMAIGEGSEVAVDGGTGADMQFNTAIGNSAGVSQNIVNGDYVDVERSTAIGHAAKVSASNSTAIGDSSNAGEDNSVAIGQKAEVQSATSIAIGQGTKIGGNAENSIAIGTSANQYSVGSKAKNSTVVGVNAWSLSEGGTVLGKSAKIQGSAANGTAIGTNATINVSAGSGNVALGADSTVSKADVGGDTAHGVVSVGQSGDKGFNRRIINVADGVNDSDAATVKQVKAVQGDVDELNKLAVTYDNTKKAVNFNGATLKNVGDIQIGNAQSTFVGSGLVNGKVYDTDAGQWAENGANATHSMAVGSKSSVRGTDSVAVGPEAAVNNGNAEVLEQSTAVGSKATVSSSFSTALGANTQAKGGYSVAVGAQSQTTGANATAIGAYAAAGENSVVVGGGEGLAAPTVSKANSTAMGTYVDIKSDNGTALGYGSQIGWNGKNSVALGADSVANEENVVSVGHTKGQANGFSGTYGEDLNRRIVNVADGINDSDAATFGQVKDVQDSVKALDASAVQYDSVSKSTVTFDGPNGTALKNVSDIVMNTKDFYSKDAQFSFQDAGLLPGDVQSLGNKWNMAIGEGSAVKVEEGTTGSKMQMNTVVGNKARITQALVDGEYQDVEKSTALGQGVTVAASNAVGVGQGSNVRGEGGVAVGMQANVSAKSGVAVGKQSKVSSNYSIAIGGSASVGSESENSVAMGYEASSLAAGGTAIGQGAKVQGSAANGTAIGKGAIVNVNAGNSVALGASSQVQIADIGEDTEYGVVSVGKSGTGGFMRRIVNVADGINDSDAATYGQVKAVDEKVSAFASGGIIAGELGDGKGVGEDTVTNGIAIGTDSYVKNKGGLAIGDGATAGSNSAQTAKYATAIGTDSEATSDYSTAIGYSSKASGKNSIAIGNSIASGENNVAIGHLSELTNFHKDNTAIGAETQINADAGTVVGKGAYVSGNYGTAIGRGSDSWSDHSTALGSYAKVDNDSEYAVALGAGSVASEANTVSVGVSAADATTDNPELKRRIVNVADGVNATDAATVGQMSSLLFGPSASFKESKTALAAGTLLTNKGTSLVEGINKNTAAINSIDNQLDAVSDIWETNSQSLNDLTEKASAFAAQTQNVDWNALNSVDWNAVSAMAAVPATMNLAVDDGQANEGDTGAEKDDDDRSPQTNGSNPGEVDGNLHVSGNTTLDGTLNVKGDATFEGNATFDKGATMKGDLNMSGNKITGLEAGDLSADSTDAVNGSQLFDVQQQVSDNRQAIGALGSRVSDLGEEVDSVGAISAALAGLHPLDYNGTGSKFQISAALGTYDGTQAAAIGGFYHFNRDTLLSIGGSTSFEGDRKTAANVGVTFRVGEGASEAPAVQDNETKQQMEAMKQEIEMLKAELEQLKNKDTEGTNDKN